MYPLTEQGVIQKQNDLNNLSDEQLLTEAKSMCSDFKNWLSNNFDLLPNEVDYLNTVPENVLFGWGAQLGVIVICRGDLEVEFPPHDPQRTKQVDVSNKDSLVSYKPGGDTVMEAQGLVKWEYQD
ncbi:hypothetical protein [Negadavirga shengliensis]|uniref:Uncharacterized protein n=1 Tax=Negadavirga shengliensis TaxID=1389218 RepID=A0ABV9T0A9_9BACT